MAKSSIPSTPFSPEKQQADLDYVYKLMNSIKDPRTTSDTSSVSTTRKLPGFIGDSQAGTTDPVAPVAPVKKGFWGGVALPTVGKTLDILNIPLHALVGAIESATGKGEAGMNVLENIKSNIAQKEDFGSLVQKFGIKNKYLAGALGFAGDVLLDPLNLVGVGLIGKAAKGIGAVSKLRKVEGIGAKLAEPLANMLEKSIAKNEFNVLGDILKTKITSADGLGVIDSIKNKVPFVRNTDTLEGVAQKLTKLTGQPQWLDIVAKNTPDQAKRIISTAIDEGRLARQGFIAKAPGFFGTVAASSAAKSPTVKKVTDWTKRMFDYNPGGAEDLFRGNKNLEESRSWSNIMADTKDTLSRHIANEKIKASALGHVYDGLTDLVAKDLTLKYKEANDLYITARKALDGVVAPTGFVKELDDWSKGQFTMGGKYKLSEVEGFNASGKVAELWRKVTGKGDLDTRQLANLMGVPTAAEAQKKFGMMAINTLGKAYGDTMRVFKGTMTWGNVGGHTRNVLNNNFSAMAAGINVALPSWIQSLVTATKAIRNPAHHLNGFANDLLALKNPAHAISGELLNTGTEAFDAIRNIANKEKGVIGQVVDFAKTAYAQEDDIFRFAHILYKDRQLGGKLFLGVKADARDARVLTLLNDANEVYMNYAKMPEVVKLLRTAPFGAPFVSFMYGYAYRFGRLLKNSPKSITLPLKLQKNIEVTNPITEDQQKIIDTKTWAQHLGNGEYGKVPFFEGPKGSKFFNYGSINPIYNLMKQASPSDSGSTLNIPILQNPFVTVPWQLATNTDTFGKPIITDKQTTTTGKILRSLGFLTKSMVTPTLAHYPAKIYEETQKPYGDPIKKILGMFGFSYEVIKNRPADYEYPTGTGAKAAEDFFNIDLNPNN